MHNGLKSIIKDIDELYLGIDTLVVMLKNEGYDETASKLQCFVHETAWTTGSGIIGRIISLFK